MSEKNKTSKKGEAKDKRSSKTPVGFVQKVNETLVSEYMLHMWADAAFGVELAYGSFVEQGFAWSLSKVRYQGVTSTVLQLQYKPRRNGSRLLREDVKGNRPRSNGKTTRGSKGNSKGSRSLPKTN